MKLSELLQGVDFKKITGLCQNAIKGSLYYKNKLNLNSEKLEIGSIHYRAQDVLPGGMFIAIKGHTADGHDFIEQAIENGAKAVVTQKSIFADSVIIEVENTRKALAEISASFFSNPSDRLVIIGITGTNGKTTTAFLIEKMLVKAGLKVGVIGSIDYHYSGKTFSSSMTTPEALDLQRILFQMLQQGVTHVVMEVSSHAIDLHRTDCCKLDICVFTNLTRDHLDYHQDMHKYWSCKKKMFTQNMGSASCKPGAVAVINCDNPYGRELLDLLPQGNITTGCTMGHMVQAEILKQDLTGIRGKIVTPGWKFDFKTQLVGKHNAENISCAAGVGMALHLQPDTIKAGIEEASFVPGRLECINNDTGRFVYVDYAHTPDALENVLSVLKVLAEKRLICVFGCGGNRDKEKRGMMGAIAGRLSDLAVITSDNPRNEPSMEIIDQIVSGIKKAASKLFTRDESEFDWWSINKESKGYIVEPDRKKAIELAVSVSGPGDIILIAGKGHETFQIAGDEIIPFDDRRIAAEALKTG